jgi:hypothetical protein
MKATASRCFAQRGQATVEFVVLALALLPLFVCVALMGKHIDMLQTAEMASRYVAFQAQSRNSSNSWKTDEELAAEVRRRFFSTSSASIKTGDVAGDFAAHRNPLWTDWAGKPLIAKFDENVNVRTEVTGLNAIAAAAYVDALGLSKMNLYSASVVVKPAKLASFKPFDTLDLTITRKTALLADAWTAKGPREIRSTIEHSVFLFPASAAKETVGLVGKFPKLVLDPAIRIGDFDWDVVPCDRLIGGC